MTKKYYYKRPIDDKILRKLFNNIKSNLVNDGPPIFQWWKKVFDFFGSSECREFDVTIPVYGKVINGKYKGSIGQVISVIGTPSDLYVPFRVRIKFSDNKTHEIDAGYISYSALEHEITDRIEYKESLEEITLSNKMGQEIKKGSYGVVYTGDGRTQRIGKVTKVVSDGIKNTIYYKTSDKKNRRTTFPDIIYILRDQETAEKQFALEVLKA